MWTTLFYFPFFPFLSVAYICTKSVLPAFPSVAQHKLYALVGGAPAAAPERIEVEVHDDIAQPIQSREPHDRGRPMELARASLQPATTDRPQLNDLVFAAPLGTTSVD